MFLDCIGIYYLNKPKLVVGLLLMLQESSLIAHVRGHTLHVKEISGVYRLLIWQRCLRFKQNLGRPFLIIGQVIFRETVNFKV
jgi:hypothetical protein